MEGRDDEQGRLRRGVIALQPLLPVFRSREKNGPAPVTDVISSMDLGRLLLRNT